MRYVLDASVAFSWYVTESFTPSARRYLDLLAAGKADFVVPEIHFLEIANALRTRVKVQQLTGDLAGEILATHLDADLEISNPSTVRALEVALEYDATVYDAMYIALALDYDIPFLTAERTTRPWVVRLGKRAVSVA